MLFNFKRKISLIACSGMLSFAAIAQGPLIKTGEHYFDNMSYSKAIDAFEQALKKKGLSDFDKNLALKKLAESYLKVKDSQNAERVLAELVGSTKEWTPDNADILLKYAQALASNSKYQESQAEYQKYNALVDTDTRGSGFSKLYNDVSVLTKNAACYKVDYLSINTTAAEFSPTFYKNGLIFVSNRKSDSGVKRVFSWNDTPFLDLFYLEDVAYLSSSDMASLGGSSSTTTNKTKKRTIGYVGNDEYTAPTANDTKTLGNYGGKNISFGGGYADVPLTESDRMKGSINSKYHEGPSVFLKDGTKVFFTRNNSNNGVIKKSSDDVTKIKLYTADAKKDGWINIKELPFNSNEYSCGDPALSVDEKVLYFSSDMPGGYGGTDIYACKFDGTSWTAPVNLGKEINTKGNERFPFIDEKGNLYFSSDGLPGLGELDIFYTQLNGSTPVGNVSNLGSPINSSNDDFGIITDGMRKSGYFSSNRKRSGADDDIYKFDRECDLSNGCDLLIAVYDADTKMPLANANVTFTSKDGATQELTTNDKGIAELSNIAEKYEYEFKTTLNGFIKNNVTYSTDQCDNETSRLEIPLSKPMQNDTTEIVTKINPDGIVNNPSQMPVGNNVMPRVNDNVKQCIIKGHVYKQGTTSVIPNVLVSLKNACDGNIASVISDSHGAYSFVANEGCDYTLEGKKDKMGSKVGMVRKLSCAKNPNGVISDISMFEQGDIVKVENIYFDYGKYNIRPDAMIELDKLVKIMRQYPKMKIELSSHTDSRSPSDFNQNLSDNRAKSSAEYLFKRGISKSRVEYKGYGETMLNNQCADGVKCSEQEHQLNRRTEVKILQMD